MFQFQSSNVAPDPAHQAGAVTGITVASVIDSFNSASGGPPRVVNAIASAGAGHWQSTLITTSFHAPGADRLLLEEFLGEVTLLDWAPGGAWRSVLLRRNHAALADALAALPPRSVLHVHGLWSPLLAAAVDAAGRLGIPYIVAPHGMLEPWAFRDRRWRKRLAMRAFQRRVLAGAAAIHTTSDAEAEHLRELRVTAAALHVIPNAIDLPPKPLRRPARDAGSRALLFLSRVHPKKGLDLLLEAWAQLRPVGWRLRIAGDGEAGYLRKLHDRCIADRLSGVDFLGHLDGESKERAFAQADAFILPSHSENFGNVVGEAMARGLPVITTTGTPWSCVQRLRLGWYVSPEPRALGLALTELFATDASCLKQMGMRGQQYVRERLQPAVIRPLLHAMYAEAIA